MTTERSSSFDPKAFFARIDEGRSIASYRKGERVFSQGEPADAVFFIQRGQAKISVVSDQGKEVIVAILEKGNFFGEGCLVGQSSRISTAAAITNARIARLDKAAIFRLVRGDPAFAEMFILHLLGRGVRVEADLIDQLFNSSEKRLGRLLLLLAKFGQEGKPEPIMQSQEALAQMIGTTRERVNLFMNKFRKLGFISYNGGIHVHSSLLNAVLHDQPHIER